MKKFLPTSKGFTLIELLVVITIIAFLSVIGMVAFTNAQKQARDGRRRADVDAIATALESNRNQLGGTYPNPVTSSLFANNAVPIDPSTSSSANYPVTYGTGSVSFVVCANNLENCPSAGNCGGNSTSSTAMTPPSTANQGQYYCRASQQ